MHSYLFSTSFAGLIFSVECFFQDTVLTVSEKTPKYLRHFQQTQGGCSSNKHEVHV